MISGKAITTEYAVNSGLNKGIEFKEKDEVKFDNIAFDNLAFKVNNSISDALHFNPLINICMGLILSTTSQQHTGI
ncbi:CLUMA_CG013020, isoform A [Clunio marinus]|uniref:CLUMA_CG013020, isoform A n=1 Tax=Clunio marinus TaxID=568069 RepID=A0A1J1IHP6_9DIPT|nr:CLUMA_CG013020, isoform A [Clunio marinus]